MTKATRASGRATTTDYLYTQLHGPSVRFLTDRLSETCILPLLQPLSGKPVKGKGRSVTCTCTSSKPLALSRIRNSVLLLRCQRSRQSRNPADWSCDDSDATRRSARGNRTAASRRRSSPNVVSHYGRREQGATGPLKSRIM